jgi:hypothetical protein
VDGELQPMELAHLAYKKAKPTKIILVCGDIARFVAQLGLNMLNAEISNKQSR